MSDDFLPERVDMNDIRKKIVGKPGAKEIETIGHTFKVAELPSASFYGSGKEAII